MVQKLFCTSWLGSILSPAPTRVNEYQFEKFLYCLFIALLFWFFFSFVEGYIVNFYNLLIHLLSVSFLISLAICGKVSFVHFICHWILCLLQQRRQRMLSLKYLSILLSLKLDVLCCFYYIKFLEKQKKAMKFWIELSQHDNIMARS